MKRTLASLALTLFAGSAMLVGCGTDTKNTTSGNPPAAPIAVENLSKELAQSYCELAFSCCTTMEQTALFGDFPMPPKTVEECTTTFKDLYDMYIFSGLKESVDAGRLKYDGALAGSCLSQIEGDCSTISEEGVQPSDTACDKIFIGLVADGGDCAQSNECATDGSYCAKAQGAVMGKCQARAKEGESCAMGVCVDGLVCDFTAMTPTCIKPLADGEACTSDFVCASEFCDKDNFGKCGPKKVIGEMCTSSQACKDSYCESQTSMCTALKADGEACMFFDECKSDKCTQDMKCGSSGPLCTGM